MNAYSTRYGVDPVDGVDSVVGDVGLVGKVDPPGVVPKVDPLPLGVPIVGSGEDMLFTLLSLSVSLPAPNPMTSPTSRGRTILAIGCSSRAYAVRSVVLSV